SVGACRAQPDHRSDQHGADRLGYPGLATRERSQGMSKAQQAAEERWPSYPAVGFSGAADRRVAFLEGVAWALPENPHPAAIKAMARAVAEHEEVYDET